MKIAVIGSGISGLSSAYFLSKKYKVDLYEKDDHFGGHSYTYEIKEGDKRILLIDGEPVPFALARVPSSDDNRGNLVMGATGEGRDLTENDKLICETISKMLKKKGILFCGIDVIGNYLTEINSTSPTGIRELDNIYQLNISKDLFDVIETKI